MSKKQTRIKLIIIPAFFVLAFIFAPEAKAGKYYVTQNGAGTMTGERCADAKSLTWYNTNAVAGDTAYICGNLTGQINPSNSGSAEVGFIKYIKDPAATEWNITVKRSVSDSPAAFITKNYIWVEGLFFYDCVYRWVEIDGQYNVFKGNRFYNSLAPTGFKIDGDRNFAIQNQFDNAPFRSNIPACKCVAAQPTPYPAGVQCTDPDYSCPTGPSDLFGVDSGSDRNIIIGNTFGKTHHNSTIFGYNLGSQIAPQYNVLRRNTTRNTWHSGLQAQGVVLMEDNMVLDVGSQSLYNPDWRDRVIRNGAMLYLQTYNSIVRRNLVKNGDYGINLSLQDDGCPNYNNRIYHNTIWNTAIGIAASNGTGTTTVMRNTRYINNIFGKDANFKWDIIAVNNFAEDGPVEVNYTSMNSTNLNYHNNNGWKPIPEAGFCYKTSPAPARTLAQMLDAYPTEWTRDNFILQNEGFVNAASEDFTLTANSSAIDRATHLTTVTADGSGTAMPVADVFYFYTGTGAPWSMPTVPGVTPEVGDTIYVDNLSAADFTARINAYMVGVSPAGTLKLTEEKNWQSGAKIYHCPGGVCFKNNAPDIGAYEYVGSTPIYITGDLNKDGKVNIADYSMFIQDFGKTGANLPADLNKNGQVEIGDYSIFISNFGKTT